MMYLSRQSTKARGSVLYRQTDVKSAGPRQPQVIHLPGVSSIVFLIKQQQWDWRTNGAPEIRPTVSEERPACPGGFYVSDEHISRRS